MEEWERVLIQSSFLMKGNMKYMDSASAFVHLLNSSSDGDIIRVEPGIYTLNGVEVTKSLIIQGVDVNNKPIFESSGEYVVIY
jgi:hypothetical protein